MNSGDRILHAAINLLQFNSYDEITFADISKETGDHWTTVRRYFGSKDKMRSILYKEQMSKEYAIPDTKTKILDAGSHMFAKNGYEGTSLDQIASNAGLSKGAVYWHFSNKSDVYLAICDRSLKQLVNNIGEKFNTAFASANQLDAIKSLVESELKSCEDHAGELPRLFLQFVSTNSEKAVQEKLSDSFANLFLETSNVLKQLQQKKLINQQLDCEALAVSLHALINGIVLMWLINPSGVLFDRVSSAVAELLWHGIGPQDRYL